MKILWSKVGIRISKRLNNVRTYIHRLPSVGLKIKEIFWKKLDLTLILGLLILSASAYCLSLFTEELLSSWLVNISAGLFSSLFIIFGIDALHKQRVEIKKRRAKDVARRDLQRLANMCVSYFLFPIGILSHEVDSLSGEIGLNWSPAANRLVLNKALQGNFTFHMSQITPDKLKVVMMDLAMLGPEIKDSINFYADLIPSEVLGELLYVRHAFNQASLSFALWGPVLFRPGEDHGNKHRLLGNAVLDYTAKVDDFTRVLGEWH